MSFVELTSQKEFEQVTKKGVSLIDFNAPWCGPCKIQEPVLAVLSEHYKDQAVVAKVNIDEYQDIALDMGIQSIPTLIIFKEGMEMGRFIGYQPEETLDKALHNALTS
jgi:thioredoxin 1